MYDFNDQVVDKKKYLRESGLHTNAKFNSLTYGATPAYEYFDIELETKEGLIFRERTFAPDPEKVFPKQKWDKGEVVGEETKDEAFKRSLAEVANKLFTLAAAFIPKADVKEQVGKARDLKELIDKVNRAIANSGNQDNAVSFLTVWSNSETKKRSNLVFPAKTEYIEAYVEGQKSTLKLSKYQLDNQMIEKYPFQGTNANAATGNGIDTGSENTNSGAADDLPF